MDYSAVLIIPATLRAQADAIGAAMGWGDVSYTIPLAPQGDTEPTHYGARADVSAQFMRWVRGLDPLPDPAFQSVIDALIADFSPNPDAGGAPRLYGRQHLDAVLSEHGLTIIAGD